jgi:hypothetical protein
MNRKKIRILSLRKQLDENVQKQRILQNHYEDISCDLKYEVDKHQMTEQKDKSHEEKLSVVSKQKTKLKTITCETSNSNNEA